MAAARPRTRFSRRPVAAAAALLGLCPTSCEGASLKRGDYSIGGDSWLLSWEAPQHKVANWRKKDNYLLQSEFVPPGGDSSSAILNSCADPSTPAEQQCSGRGYCRTWNQMAPDTNSLAFCVCNRDWAGPECTIRRKSQTKVFLMSLFGGVLGLDYFYLDLPLLGFAKLLSAGGLGFWWLLDIVRTGSGPVYSQSHRVAADLPHAVFVLVTFATFSLLGMLYTLRSFVNLRSRKRHTATHAGEKQRAWPQAGEYPVHGRAGNSGYGTAFRGTSQGRGHALHEVTRHAPSGHRY